MPPAPSLNFQRWYERASQSPQRIVDQFLAKQQLMTPETKRAWLAATPGPKELLARLQASLAVDEATLSGISYVVQDLIDVRGMPTRCGAPFSQPFDAELDESGLLIETLTQLGACCFGKTVPSEFGYDLMGRNPSFGDCPHGAGARWVCGGGAGASVRSVHEGLVPLGFGLDSSGGMRLPIALHGLFGYRMQKNDLAREGVFPIVPSLESIGFCTANLEDLLATFNAFHPLNAEPSLDEPRGYVYHGPAIGGSPEVKHGTMQLSRELLIDDDPGTHVQLNHAFRKAAQALSWIEARELYSVHHYWAEEYRDKYTPELMQRIERGGDCTQQEAEWSLDVQQRIRQAFSGFFEQYDFLIMPICPVPNPERNKWSPELHSTIRQLIAPVSLAALPALILPIECGIGRYGAVQVVLHPGKLHIVPELIAQLTGYYSA